MKELFEKLERLFNIKNGDMGITNIDQWRKNQLQHLKKEYLSSPVEDGVKQRILNIINKTIKAEEKYYYKKPQKYRDNDFNWGKFEGTMGILTVLKGKLEEK